LAKKEKKKTDHQKEVGSLQDNMGRYFDYLPTGDEGHTIIFILIFEKLYHIAI
jgi:hypothetical protein